MGHESTSPTDPTIKEGRKLGEARNRNDDSSWKPGFTAFLVVDAQTKIIERSQNSAHPLSKSSFVQVDESIVAVSLPTAVYSTYGGFYIYHPGPKWESDRGGTVITFADWGDVIRVEGITGEVWQNRDHTDKADRLHAWLAENPQIEPQNPSPQP